MYLMTGSINPYLKTSIINQPINTQMCINNIHTTIAGANHSVHWYTINVLCFIALKFYVENILYYSHLY